VESTDFVGYPALSRGRRMWVCADLAQRNPPNPFAAWRNALRYCALHSLPGFTFGSGVCGA